MALTAFQRTICRLLADRRIASGESYVAGGVALNEVLAAPRLSRDIDLFHDTATAVRTSWEEDRRILEHEGIRVSVVRERETFVEASLEKDGSTVLVQWAQDSAFRFFPLVRHPDLGLLLHPFDLATNKVLALVGRLEPRDWIDVIECDRRLQPLGYLAWAACGKDPGFSPAAILEEAGRSSRYSAAEIAALDFAEEPPDAGELSRRWHRILNAARSLIRLLPAEEAGRCVLTDRGELFTGDAEALRVAVEQRRLRFHAGSLRGSVPRLIA